MAAPLPLAALDWLEGLLPFLFLLFWIVSQIRAFFRGANPGRPQGPVVVRPAPRPPAADEAHRELARQVEEFLRRSSGEPGAGPAAGQRRGAEPRPHGGTAPPRRTAAPPPLPAPGTRRQPAPRAARPVPAAPAPRATEPSRPLGSLGGHGGDVARHVGDAFAHELRHLEPDVGTNEATAASPGVAPTTDLATLLRNPVTLRQLVLVREVLDRPVDRW